jgi:hypothetical protein
MDEWRATLGRVAGTVVNDLGDDVPFRDCEHGRDRCACGVMSRLGADAEGTLAPVPLLRTSK